MKIGIKLAEGKMVTKSNQYSKGYNAVKTVIESYVSDPTNIYKRKWIYASMPYINNNIKFPLIVINSPDATEEARDFDTNKGKNYRWLITVVSDDESEVDNVSGEIVAALENNEKDLNDNGFYNPEINSSPFNMDADENGKKIYSRPIGMIARGWT